MEREDRRRVERHNHITDTISRQIVEGLRVKTSTKEQERLVKSPTDSPEAYECYLKARMCLYKFITQTLDVADLEAAVDLFTEALERDPNFALAHSGLGVCEVNYVLKGMGGPSITTRRRSVSTARSSWTRTSSSLASE